ncbi:hypothetical protein GCM10018787_53070 [Streptomyces thermodiastaticus]|nr:hypothetical protein GCM10018787_53070 [Streptomyces thermodiastaticus]
MPVWAPHAVEDNASQAGVKAPEPSVHKLAEALADFGARRRAAALGAGEPVTRPSERRAGRRRSTTT